VDGERASVLLPAQVQAQVRVLQVLVRVQWVPMACY